MSHAAWLFHYLLFVSQWVERIYTKPTKTGRVHLIELMKEFAWLSPDHWMAHKMFALFLLQNKQCWLVRSGGAILEIRQAWETQKRASLFFHMSVCLSVRTVAVHLSVFGSSLTGYLLTYLLTVSEVVFSFSSFLNPSVCLAWFCLAYMKWQSTHWLSSSLAHCGWACLYF